MCSLPLFCMSILSSLQCLPDIQRQVLTELHAILQMSTLKVNIMPAVEGRAPINFCMHWKHDAETVIGLLKSETGSGILKDSNGVPIPSDPQDRLEAGEYFFTLLSAPQDETHNLVLTESDPLSYAWLGYQIAPTPAFLCSCRWKSRVSHGQSGTDPAPSASLLLVHSLLLQLHNPMATV